MTGLRSHWTRLILLLCLATAAGISQAVPQAASRKLPGKPQGWAAGISSQQFSGPGPDPGKRGDDPVGRALWFARGRISQDGVPPAKHYLNSLAERARYPLFSPKIKRSLYSPNASSASSPASFGGGWQELGPKPELDPQYGDVAGRVTAIAVDYGKDSTGNTVYIGTSYGGIWKSTNALSATPSFTAIDDALPTLSIGSLALDDSTTPTTIYAGTGDANLAWDSYYALGILKSSDGGQTWTLTSQDASGNSLLGLAFGKIVVDPKNPQIVMAAATFSGAYLFQNERLPQDNPGLYISTNGGQSWTLDTNNLPQFIPCTDIAYDASTGTFYAAFIGSGIYDSTDDGTNWYPLPTPFSNNTAPTFDNFQRASLAAQSGTLAVLIANGKGTISTPTPCGVSQTTGCDTGLAITTNNGASWQPVAVPTNLFCAGSGSQYYCQGPFDQFLGMTPSDELLAGGIDAWIASGSGMNTTWTNLTKSYSGGAVHPDEHALAITPDGAHWYIGNDGGIWESDNSGVAWNNLNATLGAIQLLGATADPTTPGAYLGGSQDNGTALSSAANGQEWKSVWGGDGGYTAINPQQAGQYFTENYDVSLQRSDDSGANFTTVVDDKTISDPSDFYVPYELEPANPANAILATDRVWRGPATPTSPGQGWAPISPDLSGGSNCGAFGAGLAFLSAIAEAPSSADVIYTGSEDGQLEASTDATAATPSWTTLQFPVCRPVGALAVSASNAQIVYAGLQGFAMGGQPNLLWSTNGGQNWNTFNNFPNTPVNAIAIDPDNSSNIFVGTDIGVFVTSDGGMDNPVWFQMGTGLPAAAVLGLSIEKQNGQEMLLAATHGRGAWTIPFAAPPNFNLSVSPANITVNAGIGPEAITVATQAVNGDTAPISLSCSVIAEFSLPNSPLPSCSPTSTTLTPGQNTTLELETQNSGWGDYEVTIQASDGINSYSQSIVAVLQDFSIYTNAASSPMAGTPIIMQAGGTGQGIYNVVLLPSNYNVNSSINLSCTSPPAGFSCSFNPAAVPYQAPGTTGPQTFGTETISASASTPPGSYSLEITGTDGNLTHQAAQPITLNAYALSADSASKTVILGTDSEQFQITATSLSSYSGTIALSCANISASGVSCAFNPTSITAGQSGSTLTVSGLSQMQSLGVNFQVVGASGAQSVQLPLQVLIASFYFDQVWYPPAILVGVTNDSFGAPGMYAENGFSQTVQLSCSAGNSATCSVAPTSITPTSNGNYNISVSVGGLANLPVGSSVPVTLTGVSGSITRTVSGAVSVGDFSLNAPQSTETMARGASSPENNYYVNMQSIDDYMGQVSYACASGTPFTCSASGTNFSNVQLSGTQNLTADTSFQVIGSSTDQGVTVSHAISLQLLISDFSVAASPASASVSAGQSGAYTIALAAIHDFAYPIQFSCSNLPTDAYCSFATNPTPWGNLPATVALSIVTTARSGLGPGRGPDENNWQRRMWLLLLICAIAWGGWRERQRLAPAAALLLLLAFQIACGGGSTPAPTPAQYGTPAGTYNVTISGTYQDSGSGSLPDTHTTTVQLVVQ